MRVRDHICHVLSKNIPSARCIISDSEEILTASHEDLAVDIQRTAVGASNHLQIVNLISNTSQQLENFQAESDVGPALHATRQVAYWSSILVSMVSNSAVSSHSTMPSISTASVIADCQATASIPLTAVIANHQATSVSPAPVCISTAVLLPVITNHQPALGYPLSALIMNHPGSSTSPTTLSVLSQANPSITSSGVVSTPCVMASQPVTGFISSSASSSNISTTSIVSSHQPVLFVPLPSSAFISNQPVSSFTTATSFTPISSSSTVSTCVMASCPVTCLISSCISTSTISTTAIVTSHQSALFLPSLAGISGHSASFMTPTASFVSSQAIPSITSSVLQSVVVASIPATGFISSNKATTILPTTATISSHCDTSSICLPRNVQTLSSPTTFINPGNQPAASLTITDPATILIYREYGSGSLPEWLDSLQIPRNVESLEQVKELWEISAMNRPPLCKWTVVMCNHCSPKGGKNSSLFSQRNFIYNLFKNNNFNENAVSAKYNEDRPGKLYKILNTKKK